MEQIVVPADARPCQNCGQPLLGHHCYACGQPVKGLVRHFGTIIGDFLDSVFEWDSRTLRTLGPLLYRPGFLSNAYFAGHRVRYVSPVRLFVFLCVIAFFVLRFSVDTNISSANRGPFASAESLADVEQIEAERRTKYQAELAEAADEPRRRARLERRIARLEEQAGQTRQWLALREQALQAGLQPPPRPTSNGEANIQFNDREWDPQTNPVQVDAMPVGVNRWLNTQVGRAKANIARVNDDPSLLVDTFLQTLPQTFFVLLPLFALLLKVAYVFKRRLYMEHLIVALHSHAFLCLVLLILLAIGGLRGLLGDGLIASGLGTLGAALAIWVPIYLFLTQKRVYGQGWIMTTLKFILIGICYVLLLAIGAVINLMTNLVAL